MFLLHLQVPSRIMQAFHRSHMCSKLVWQCVKIHICKIFVFSVFHIEKPCVLVTFLNVGKAKKKICKCKNLKSKWYFTASKTVIDMVIRKPNWELNLSHLHHSRTCYQLIFCGQCKGGFFYKSCEITVKNVKNEIAY